MVERRAVKSGASARRRLENVRHGPDEGDIGRPGRNAGPDRMSDSLERTDDLFLGTRLLENPPGNVARCRSHSQEHPGTVVGGHHSHR